LEEAQQVIDEKTAKNETRPFAPPPSLKKKYEMAIAKYDGTKYCQIRQLQGVFVF
jgi:hypothetical protein